MTGIPFIPLPVRLRTGDVLRLLFVVSLYIGTVGSVSKVWAVDSPFPVGEKLTYRISWSNFMEVGKVELLALQASSSTPGTFRLQLRATTTPAIANIYPFKDEFVSLFDVALGLPGRFEKNFVERKRTVKETVEFNQFERVATVTTPGRPLQQVPIEWGTQDPLSALYLMRSLGLKPGLQISFPVLDGGKVYKLDLQVTGSDLISIQAGSFNTQRVEVRLRRDGTTLTDKKITVWFSTDNRKLPVLVAANLSFGSALIELTSHSD
jgi:hypothetical protein